MCIHFGESLTHWIFCCVQNLFYFYVNSIQGCPADQFDCGNNQCIERGFMCDGFPDCPDRRDELNCSKYAEVQRARIILCCIDLYVKIIIENCCLYDCV